MEPGDCEPPEWLQVPTGSKRPSPSPSEGESDREIKKSRSQYSNDDQNNEPQRTKLVFPNDFLCSDSPVDHSDTLSSYQDAHRLPFTTVPDCNMEYEGLSAAFPATTTDFGSNRGADHVNAALDVDSQANTHLWEKASLHQGSESHVDTNVRDGTGYSYPYRNPITSYVGSNAWIDNVNVSIGESEALMTDQNSAFENRELANVGSIPIRRTQEYEPHSQSSTISLSKEPIDGGIKCDVCFGVLIESPSSSLTLEDAIRSIPIHLRPVGNYFILQSQVSGKHAGILKNSGLLKIFGQFPLKLNATLLVPDLNSRPTVKSKSRSNASTASALEHRARIAVHGFRTDKEAIGRLLTDAGLSLQHPSAAELLPEVEYDNPHYLLRPGAEMPKVEDLSLDFDDDIRPQNELENDTRSSNLLRIFESAGADGSGLGPLKETQSPRLRSALMTHQMTSLAFMLEKESGIVQEPMFPPLWTTERSEAGPTMRYRHTITGSLEYRPYPIMGGILADDMGLGKTMSVLALICSSLDFYAANISEHSMNPTYQRTLVVAPKSTIHGWEHQIYKHVHEGALQIRRYHGSGREEIVKDLLVADIVITTYETLRAELAVSKRSPLYSWQWLRVILDEAHHIRNRSSQVFASVCQLKARHRWCLTGTPVHNSLDDYGALLSFLRVYPFQAKSQFMAYIAKPVEEQDELGVRRLQELVRATCLRRTKQSTLESGALILPHRSEQIEYVHLYPEDQALYESVKLMSQKTAAGLGKHLQVNASAKEKQDSVMVLLDYLRRICDHGKELVPHLSKNGAEYNLTLESAPAQRRIESSTCSSCGGETSGSSGFTETSESLCASCAASETTLSDPQLKSEPGQKQDLPPSPATSMEQSSLLRAVRPSAKVAALIKNLRHESLNSGYGQKPRKSVVFSYWVKMLDLIELALRAEMIECQRIDGQTSLEGRRRAVSEFSSNSNCEVMLASIGSAAEGIDLTAAGIVHLIEPHWNPMVEAQAVDRIYRIGQAQEVTIIRYIVPYSVETYVRAVQQEKMNIIDQANRANNTTDSEVTIRRQQALEMVLAPPQN